MDRKEIFDAIGTLAVAASTEELDWSSVTEDSSIESLGFDSLAIMDLLFDLEQEFGVEISAKEILEIETVGGLIDFIQAKRAG